MLSSLERFPVAPRSVFTKQLEARRPSAGRRTWVFVPYDQLTDRIGPLARLAPEAAGIVLVESRAKAARRPYHKQKLALVLANLRHFALEQAARGVAVRHVGTDGGCAEVLEDVAREVGPLQVMQPAERELRVELAPLVDAGHLEILPHEGWLTTTEQFEAAAGTAPPWRMDAFYRHVRRATGLLMEDGKPAGGKWSHDAANRKPWRGEPPAPTPPRFRPDGVTQEVVALVEGAFVEHPGRLDARTLPVTAAHARRLWTWAKTECLRDFGPYEDAMSERSRGLFHTRIAPLLNHHRLLPARVVAEAAALDVPIESREGFVRQILGWREFVRHVHEATDGFRDLPGGSAPSHLGAHEPLPAAYWGEPSGLRCLDHVVETVWEEGYSHHITRLMVLSNLATLLDVEPRELTDWFWAAYVDAYDWVVEPNVLGMGTFALGDVMTTKPYVSGAAYIDRMGDHCSACAFDPKRDCPITPLYWAFLARHEETLGSNLRMRMPYASLRRRDPARREADARVFEHVRSRLAEGRAVDPAGLAAALEAKEAGR